MKKYFIIIIAIAVAVSTFSGCQKNPSMNIVVNKNDGSFEEKILQTFPTLADKQEVQENMLQCEDTFVSTDGSVSFTIDISKEVINNTKKVIEVTPHALTDDDIQRVAKALLGDVLFYERRYSKNPEYSKSQYQQMIGRFTPYTNREDLIALMGGDTYLGYIQDYIELWTRKLETASEMDPRKPCDWTLKKERHYNNSEAETEGRMTEDDSDVLLANAEKDGIEYIFSAITKNKGAYKINRLNLNLTEGLGLYPVDMAIYRSMLCRTSEPTYDQITEIKSIVTKMLDEMQLGQWYIYSTDVVSKEIGNAIEYTVDIIAAPLLFGDPVLLGQNLGNYREAYNSSYPSTYAEFSFSASGDLIYFNLDSPLDVVEKRNDSVGTLSTEELMEKCIESLSYSDAGSYSLTYDTIESLESSYEEKLLCQITISDAEYGLGRRMVLDKEDYYYYIPVLILRGVIEYIGAESGRCYYTSNQNVNDELPALIWINAVDGSIIR